MRYSYHLRIGAAAERLLLSEWDRCRWVWNQCVTEVREAYKRRKKIGPAALDKMCTAWRAEHSWLRKGRRFRRSRSFATSARPEPRR